MMRRRGHGGPGGAVEWWRWFEGAAESANIVVGDGSRRLAEELWRRGFDRWWRSSSRGSGGGKGDPPRRWLAGYGRGQGR